MSSAGGEAAKLQDSRLKRMVKRLLSTIHLVRTTFRKDFIFLPWNNILDNSLDIFISELKRDLHTFMSALLGGFLIVWIKSNCSPNLKTLPGIF